MNLKKKMHAYKKTLYKTCQGNNKWRIVFANTILTGLKTKNIYRIPPLQPETTNCLNMK